jgi:hypothetical protein
MALPITLSKSVFDAEMTRNMRAILNPHLARRAPAGEEDMARSSYGRANCLGKA